MPSNRLSVAALLALMPYALAAPATTATAPSTVSASPTASPTDATAALFATSIPIAPPLRTHGSVSHGPFLGTATTSGALTAASGILGTAIPSLPPNPNATTYPSDGQLHNAEPAPYVPAGGVGTNGTPPVYNAKSDFDYESLSLALYQEWIELDLFLNGLATFSVDDFLTAGLTAEDRFLIEFMANQEIGHATMLSNILGSAAPSQCNYNYPFTTVMEFVDFCQKLTKFGEAGVYGFLAHLDSRAAATLLLQSITTEARQQMIFRQFEGLFPMPVWFEVGVPQSWAWTLIAPYIADCPANQTRLVWQNFPALWVLNQPNPALINGSAAFNETLTPGVNPSNTTVPSNSSCVNATAVGENCNPAITHNRTIPLSFPGRKVYFEWETPGKAVGPNNSYITSSQAGSPKYVAWVTQLNVTYSALIINATNATAGWTLQPNVSTYQGDPAINGTMFVAITDSNPFLTPFNLSLINPHVVAGPALYQSG